MNNKFKSVFFILFFATLTLPSMSFAQDSLHNNHYNYGFGAAFNDYRFYFPMYVNQYMKIEPEFKVSFSKATWSEKREYLDIEIGIGAFYRYSHKQIEIYLGIRLGYLNYKSENDHTILSKESGYYLAPTLGGEYFILERFSLGAELQIRYSYRAGDTNYNDEPEEIKNQGLRTYTYFMMRFYVF